ncbi:MAG: ABC transporter permease subunit [Rhodobacteraceae bacterium]|nr:ABC transporter permease subunit [Paracoccaceae bacterium]
MRQKSRYREFCTYAGTDYSLFATIALSFAFSLLVWFLTHGQFAFPKAVSEQFHFAQSINNGEKWLQKNLREYTRAVSSVIGAILESIELFLWFKPWPIIVIAIGLPALAYGGLRLALLAVFGVMFWGMMDMWDPAMSTLALMGVSVVFSIFLGVIVGVMCSQNDLVEAFVKPILDTMQTMPAFVYLLPAIIFFGIGGPSATMAIIIYAMPPVVRLTNLGIRQVPETTIESAQSYGTTRMQMLTKVQLPQALPSIMLGVNQTIMMALGLAVLATFIGAGGLGEEVWKALRKLKVGWSLEGGLCIVFMAIIFDRLSLAMSKPASSGLLVDPSQMTFRLLPQKWVHWAPARMVEIGIGWVWDFVVRCSGFVVHIACAGVCWPLEKVNKTVGQSVRRWMRAHGILVFGLLLILAILAWDTWVAKIGYFPKSLQFTLRGPVDNAVDWLAVNPTFIGFTKGLRAFIYLYVLNPLDKFIVGLPWWYVLAVFFVVVWRSVGIGFAFVTVAMLLFTGLAGLWGITMYTLASTLASITICLLFGLPLGILSAQSKVVDSVLTPILDAMQTMPAFVYLIPVLMFFGGNPVTAVIATVIYAIPPMIRMTKLGLQQLPEEINEVSRMFGSTSLQTLLKVKLPMASPSIMLGVNQAVVMALAMQVITPLVAGLGLGKEVFHAMNTADTGRGLVAGIGIVLLAIVLDRLTQAWTRNQRYALGL